MKVTIELPDDLYRRVKSQAALSGRTVREVTTELYQLWLGEGTGVREDKSAVEWLDEWVALGDASLGGAPAGPTTREILATDRSRLDQE